MKGILALAIFCYSLLLGGCSQDDPMPVSVARNYFQCRIERSAMGSACYQYQSLFLQIDEIFKSPSIRENIGQTIMNAQIELVTLQEERAKKSVDQAQQQEARQSIHSLQRKVLVLYSAFLIMSAQE